MSKWERRLKLPWYMIGPGDQDLFWNRTRTGRAIQFGYDENGIEVDEYGNPIDGSRQKYCCFPNCGCPEARLCMAEEGPNRGADFFLGMR